MPTLRVKVLSANNLPRMDPITQNDAYCQLRCGGQFFQTHVFRKSNNPQWNAEFHFSLMNPMSESLQVSVWDRDRFSRDDQLGYAMFPLNQLYMGRPLLQTVPLMGGKGGTLTIELTALDFGLGAAPQAMMPSPYGMPMQAPYGHPHGYMPPQPQPHLPPPPPQAYHQQPYHQPMPPHYPQQPYMGYPSYPGGGSYY